ncbi:hypothetical protein M5D96_001252, partial [Drosophila gunungcola]
MRIERLRWEQNACAKVGPDFRLRLLVIINYFCVIYARLPEYA